MTYISYSQNGTLVPGVHTLTLSQFEQQFGVTSWKRRQLFLRLKAGLKNLKEAGVKDVYLDGSYTTKKTMPNDIDGCWDAHKDIDINILDPVFLDFNHRHLMKQKYGVDFFISQTIEGDSGVPFVEFFQTDRNGNRKGIVHICLMQASFTT